jgi:2'-5' RNA ligase
MQNSRPRVKKKAALTRVMTLATAALALSSCITAGPPLLGFHLNPKETLAAPFDSHKNWLGENLRSPALDRIREKIEEDRGGPLKTRGETHITVVTPPEWETLSKKVEPAEIDGLAQKLGMQNISYEPVCVGLGQKDQKDQKLQTYFVVVKSPGLLEIRQKLEDLYRERGGTGSFEAMHFHPHITLGFSERDLFEQDGVIKDESSCLPGGRLN